MLDDKNYAVTNYLQTIMSNQAKGKSSLLFALQTIILDIEVVKIVEKNSNQESTTKPPMKHFQIIISPVLEEQSNQIQPENSKTVDNSKQGSPEL